MTQPTRLDPRIAWHIDARALLALLPHTDQSDLYEIRREFARAIQGMRPRAATWQDAWNKWTAAVPGRTGQAVFTRPRCHECRGRGFTHRHVARNLSRTGSPYGCAECGGTGRGGRVTIQARHAITPNPQEAP